MKSVYSFFMVLSLVSLSFINPLFADPTESEVVNVTADHLFIPQGFDNNDEVEVVIDGYFPNGCYKLTDAEYKIDEKLKTIEIQPKARLFNRVCAQWMVPYTQVVKLGYLDIETYQIQIVGSELKKSLTINESKNQGPDNIIYAPVDSVNVEWDQDVARYVASLTLHYTSSCMVFQQMDYIHEGDNTIVLLPKVRIEDRIGCKKEDRIEKGVKFTLPEIAHGRYLLHVRSYNGKAINQVFSAE